MYDRSIRMYDEPYPPEELDKSVMNGTLQQGRFLAYYDSYLTQMKTIHQLGVRSVLEIGPGESIVAEYMKSLGLIYETMDIIEDYKPTILSKLEDVDADSYRARYDIVCAFQVLEHSPYERFIDNINKMATMSKKYVFISFPLPRNAFFTSTTG